MADAEPEMVITKEMEAEEAKLQKEAAAEPVDLPTVIPPPHTTTLASAPHHAINRPNVTVSMPRWLTSPPSPSPSISSASHSCPHSHCRRRLTDSIAW